MLLSAAKGCIGDGSVEEDGESRRLFKELIGVEVGEAGLRLVALLNNDKRMVWVLEQEPGIIIV